jgi:hypothetical protein
VVQHRFREENDAVKMSLTIAVVVLTVSMKARNFFAEMKNFHLLNSSFWMA